MEIIGYILAAIVVIMTVALLLFIAFGPMITAWLMRDDDDPFNDIDV